MTATRTKIVGRYKIEEFYWNGKLIVYVNDRRFNGSYGDALTECNMERGASKTLIF